MKTMFIKALLKPRNICLPAPTYKNLSGNRQWRQDMEGQERKINSTRGSFLFFLIEQLLESNYTIDRSLISTGIYNYLPQSHDILMYFACLGNSVPPPLLQLPSEGIGDRQMKPGGNTPHLQHVYIHPKIGEGAANNSLKKIRTRRTRNRNVKAALGYTCVIYQMHAITP